MKKTSIICVLILVVVGIFFRKCEEKSLTLKPKEAIHGVEESITSNKKENDHIIPQFIDNSVILSSSHISFDDFFQALKSRDTAITVADVDDLLKIIRHEKRENDLTLAINLSELIAKNSTDDAIIKILENWPKGAGQSTLVPNIFRLLVEKQGFEKSSQIYNKLPRNSSDDIEIAAGGARELSKMIFKIDDAKGLLWLENLPEGLERDSALTGINDIIQAEIDVGGRGKLDYLLSVVNSDFLSDKLYELGYKFLNKSNPEEAREWLLKIEENRPISADNLILKQIPSAESIDYINKLYELNLTSRADSALVEFAKIDSAQTPQKTLEWLAQLQPGGARDKAIAQAVVNWRQIDIAAARNWAENFKDSSVSKSALKWLK